MALLKTILIGIGAGLAAALLFEGLDSNSLFGVALVFLAPLPIAIATLSFGASAGIASVLAGTARVAAIDPHLGAVFLVLIALPAGGLAYLAALARPLASPSGAPAQEWYPLARLLADTAIGAAAAILLAAEILGYSQDEIAREFARELSRSPSLNTLTPEEIERSVRLYLAWMPFLLPGGLTGMLVFALWAGGRIARLSGLLPRPWTPLWSVRLPVWVSYLFLASAAASFVGGPVGQVAAVLAGAACAALAFSGWAAVHALTLGQPWRIPVLSGAYLLALIGGGLLLPMIFGLADSFLDFRARMGGKPST